MSKHVDYPERINNFGTNKEYLTFYVICRMSNKVLLSFGFTLLSTSILLAQYQAAPQEWEINIESGTELREAYRLLETTTTLSAPVDGAEQEAYAPTLGLSAMLRIPNLRAYYGLRLDGHYATTTGLNPVVSIEETTVEGNTYTASVLANYKAFLFDMEGDCDCPRWDKTNFFKKAFYVEFGAGYGRQSFSTETVEDRQNRGGFSYRAGIGLAIRMKKQWDIYLAGAGYGLIGPEAPIGRNSISIRPALGFTWRPFYNRF